MATEYEFTLKIQFDQGEFSKYWNDRPTEQKVWELLEWGADNVGMEIASTILETEIECPSPSRKHEWSKLNECDYCGEGTDG